ncbi:MAG: dihydrolipoamide acetyltransferase family protein [Acidimicrobiales bacterium]|nr:dihydrolipoamide acetyltransferase family protein [Acidimicrobiales bacterium]MDP6761086.1 dihydrolipoamide acetyltransferase family protein [Acidimicrobiales bacterium]MDP7507301.1 dihydrolipoamide acetyltransferase family protein [Acidimicrobiales bacterium]MEE1565358.1 dihydrolipoamide acetyltransferase family protein [Acidimicrobiales bacterium]
MTIVADLLLPQLGETVTEGTITRWARRAGDRVEADDVLYEVSTDKVDSEVPAGFAGVLTEIVVGEGATVQVGEVIARYESEGAAPVVEAPAPRSEASAGAAEAPPAAPPTPTAPAPTAGGARLLSPVVRALLADHGLDPSRVPGSGLRGRITRRDVEQYLRDHPGHVEAFTSIRRRTAQHMVSSKSTSPHVLTAMEVDYGRVEEARRAHGPAWKAAEGRSLTYLPFIVRAVAEALVDHPRINASVGDGELIVHSDLNLAVAVDLDFEGLVAPVVRRVGQMTVPEVSRAIADMAERARAKKLSPDDLAGGTFTVTNPGQYGTLFQFPIINQPQVAILSTDGVTRKPVVEVDDDGNETVGIGSVGVLALAWDHRAFDGAYAASFLRQVRHVLESSDWVDVWSTGPG